MIKMRLKTKQIIEIEHSKKFSKLQREFEVCNPAKKLKESLELKAKGLFFDEFGRFKQWSLKLD